MTDRKPQVVYNQVSIGFWHCLKMVPIWF